MQNFDFNAIIKTTSVPKTNVVSKKIMEANCVQSRFYWKPIGNTYQINTWYIFKTRKPEWINCPIYILLLHSKMASH